MKKMEKQRKGFTLTELAIVIAVIAILIAVLVPTFTSLISKANESADKQMIKNINTTLVTEDTISGINTPSDALDAVAEVGYTLEKLTPTSEGNYIVYDQTTKTFALLDSDGNTLYAYNDMTIDPESPSTWWIVSSTSEMTSATRSYILTGDIASTATETTASTSGVSLAKTSVNGGHKAAASSMSYDSETGVLTYTGFGGINTYNVTSNITKIVYDFSTTSAGSYSSYYDTNNFVINIGISATLVEIKTSVSLTIDSHGASDTVVKVTVDDSATDVVVTVNDYSGALYVESDSVTVTSATTTTVTTITETEYSSASTSSGTLELGNEQYPYLISSVDEWLAFCNGSKTTDGYYWSVTCDLDFSNVSLSSGQYVNVYKFTGYIDFNGHEVSNIALANCYGHHKGSGYDYSALFYLLLGDSQISNLNYEIQNLGTDYAVRPVLYVGNNSTETTATLYNVTVTGSVDYDDNNTSSFVYVVNGKASLTFENCTNKANITSTGYTAAFLGKVSAGNDSINQNKAIELGSVSVSFINCVNYGTVQNIGTSSGYASMLFSNPCAFSSKVITLDYISVKDCINYGSIYGTYNVNLFCGYTGSTTLNSQEITYDKYASNLESSGALVNDDSAVCAVVAANKITINTDNTFNLSTVSGATSYTITFSAFLSGDKTNGTYKICEISLSSLDEYTLYNYSFIDYDEDYENNETFIKVSDYLYTITLNDTTYYVINYTTTATGRVYLKNGSVTLSLRAYANDGSMLNVATATL